MTMTMEGPLSKWTNVMKGWQYRWFVLDDASGLFSYYTSREKMSRGVRRGCVRLRGAVVGIDDEDEATFTVTVDGKTFHFQVSFSFTYRLEKMAVIVNSCGRTKFKTLKAEGDKRTFSSIKKTCPPLYFSPWKSTKAPFCACLFLF
jgi:hypothetical protein